MNKQMTRTIARNRLRDTILLCAVCLLAVIPATAQTPPLAAILEVTYGGVEVRAADATNWLPIQARAVMPTVEGDSYRTDATGRALLQFPETETAMLLLPNSTYTLTTYTGEADAPEITGTLERGEIIGRVWGADHYTIDGASFGEVTAEIQPAHFAMTARETESVLVSWRGEYTLTDTTLMAEDVLYQTTDTLEQLAAPTPYPSPAVVVGTIEGCPGNIITANGQALNARTGPSTNDLLLGQFPDGADVRVMGIISAGGWVRVQFRSGFGWIERLAVSLADESCELPILPDDSYEQPTIIFNPQDIELTLLRPFYGDRDYDPIFYRPLPIEAP